MNNKVGTNILYFAFILLGAFILGFFAVKGVERYHTKDAIPTTVEEIKHEARRSSVQPMFDVPVIKASFTYPIRQEESLTPEQLLEKQNKMRDELNEEIKKTVDEAIKAEREFQNKDRYKSYLTSFEKYGVEPYGEDKIILGAITPKWAKFPERVLTVYKAEKTTVSVHDEKDVLAVSDLANVSPRVAKNIISRLQTDGYSIHKRKVDLDAEVKLIWFRSGWEDPRPQELKWSVTIDGNPPNLIKGYDTRGILEIFPVPSGKTVKVVAEYHDLYDDFKPKAQEIINKERIIDRLKEELDRKEKQFKKDIEQLEKQIKEEKEDKYKRDITTATLMDVMRGTVKLEQFWYRTAASGIFLGNSKIREGMYGYSWRGIDVHSVYGQEKAFVLTNAHVANMSINYELHVSEDKEVMWIILPAWTSIRHTQDSDMYGSPAQMLAIDDRPVSSWDYDCAVMVTSKVPGYNHTVKLGDSDKVTEGDMVTMVGNPSMTQKFLTQGVVANTDYSLMKSHLIDRFLYKGIPRAAYNWLMNTNFWFDTPIGTGGTSGSGVWALSGSEKGKVIAIHNAGLSRPTLFTEVNISSGVDNIDVNLFTNKSVRIFSLKKDDWKDVISEPNRDLKFVLTLDEFVEENPSFVLTRSGYQELSGMNAGIKINDVKRYLQERGLDPEEFGWEKADRDYWQR
jgi:hypothetical protein